MKFSELFRGRGTKSQPQQGEAIDQRIAGLEQNRQSIEMAVRNGHGVSADQVRLDKINDVLAGLKAQKAALESSKGVTPVRDRTVVAKPQAPASPLKTPAKTKSHKSFRNFYIFNALRVAYPISLPVGFSVLFIYGSRSKFSRILTFR